MGGVALQADHPRQAHGGLAAAGFRLLLNKQVAVVLQRHGQGFLADVLLYRDGVKRIVFSPFGNVRQGEDAARQQAAGLQIVGKLRQLVFHLAKG